MARPVLVLLLAPVLSGCLAVTVESQTASAWQGDSDRLCTTSFAVCRDGRIVIAGTEFDATGKRTFGLPAIDIVRLDRDLVIEDVHVTAWPQFLHVNATGCEGCQVILNNVHIDARPLDADGTVNESRSVSFSESIRIENASRVVVDDVSVRTEGGGTVATSGPFVVYSGGSHAIRLAGEIQALEMRDVLVQSDAPDAGRAVATEPDGYSNVEKATVDGLHVDGFAIGLAVQGRQLAGHNITVRCGDLGAATGLQLFMDAVLDDVAVRDCVRNGITAVVPERLVLNDAVVTGHAIGLWVAGPSRGENAALQIERTRVEDNVITGMQLLDVHVDIQGSSLRNNGYGWRQASDYFPHHGGINVARSSGVIRQTVFETNEPYHVATFTGNFQSNTLAGTVIDARENWWGGATGPKVLPKYFPWGELPLPYAGFVTEDVQVAPWLDAPPGVQGEKGEETALRTQELSGASETGRLL